MKFCQWVNITWTNNQIKTYQITKLLLNFFACFIEKLYFCSALPGFFIVQGIAYLDSQLIIWNIEINLIAVIIEEYASIVNIVTIDTEQLNSHKVLQNI